MNRTDSPTITLKSLCSLVIAMLGTSFSHSEQIKISTFEQESIQIDVSTEVMTDLYRRLGHEMKLIPLPGKRSIIEANKGTVDGELIRMRQSEKLLTNLTRIPTPIDSIKVIAITLIDGIRINSPADLVGKKIGSIHGLQLTDKIVEGLPHQTVESIDSLFKILLVGRVDVIIFPELDSKYHIKNHGLSDKIAINTPPILEMSVYHFINKSKPALIKSMSELLAKLKETGELEAITLKAEQAHY
jgi:polar amino acid transport system substrate-binding protein